MKTVLSVYSKNALKEFVLPSEDNTEIILLLEHSVFRLKNDIRLKLEILDGDWRFQEMHEKILIDEKEYDGKVLEDQDSFILISQNNEVLAIVVRRVESSFAVYSKYNLKGNSKILIGSGKNASIVYSAYYGGAQIISENHVELVWRQNQWVLSDKSTNGTFINDVRISADQVLEFGDHINIWGLKLVYLGDTLAVSSPVGISIDESVLKEINIEKETIEMDLNSLPAAAVSFEKNYYHRSPRNMEALDTEPIEIEAPPTPNEENEMPLLMLIGPSLTMMLPMLLGTGMAIIGSQMSGSAGGSYMYTGLITAACSGLFGAFWAIANVRYAKKRARQEETRRFEAYSEYLMKCAETIKGKYVRSINILQERYPSLDKLFQSDNKIPEELWGRNRTHSDFLYHRLGTGDIPFQIEINIPRERFTLINDTLADKPQYIKDSYKILHDVPVGIDLEDNTLIGVVGGFEKAGAYQVIYNLVVQIASQNCYTDVKLAFLARDEKHNGQDAWSFSEWLPHTWSQDKKSRYVALEAPEASDVCYDLMQILRQRAEAAEGPGGDRLTFTPYYVLFVEDESLLQGELINKYIFNKSQRLGFTTVLMAERYEELPNACECIIQNDEEYKGIFNVRNGRNNGTQIQFDTINMGALKKLAKILTNIEVNEVEVGGEIPNAVTFFELYGVSRLEELNVLDRWKKNRTYDNMKALIGLKSGGQHCYLDLHEKYHGPHGLVAGTTGSGKSETLQTYILSLALNFSPDDIGFFIIDYKGGGMGNLFSGLPHVLGQISNLSGNQIRRAMVSIKSENLRRQRVFNENGVNNINAYTRLYKNGEAKMPVPHLLIIIDEFAELKREEPDFMRELISVAQVGRSLGVHLILATQKPSGTVDDNIWSNSKFRLCLRVQDRQDSMDMLHKPDAAYLTQAGRGYLQVGNDELYEQFQSGWSGAVYDEETGSAKQIIAKLLTHTGRAGLVGNHLMMKRKMRAKLRWIAFLYEVMLKADGNLDVCYELLENAGIEYPESDYNSKLLRNFILLGQGAHAHCGKDGDINVISAFILEESENKKIKLPEMKEKSQLDAVVEYLAQLTKQSGYQKQPPLWLPVLPYKMYLRQIEEFQNHMFTEMKWPEQTERWELKAVVGFCDDPVNQFQMPLFLNFSEEGNHAVCGVGMSGKSVFLQTVIYSLIQSYSPEYVNIYILDFSNRMLEVFEEDAHVGGILYENDVDTVGKFLHMIQEMIRERKELFHGGNYYQYVRKNGMVCPAVVVAIDNIANFREKTEEKFDDVLLQISRECTSNGIYLLISGAGFSMSEIPGRLSENIRRVVALEMQDKFAYADVLKSMQIAVIPEAGIAGRGLVEVDGAILEFQTCLAVDSADGQAHAENDAADDYGRGEAIREECRQMSEYWTGKRAKPIPFIPEKPVWSDFSVLEEARQQFGDTACLPIGYNLETASVTSISLPKTYCYLISGKARTGKTNLLRILMKGAAEKKGRITVVEFGSTELQGEAESLGAGYIDSVKAFYEFLQMMIPVFQERNAQKMACKKQAMEEDEIFAKMSENEPYFVFISDIVEYAKILHGAEARELNLNGAITNFQEKGSMLNIYFFAAFNWDKRADVLGMSVYESFIRYKCGVHLGGCADTQSILEFQDISFHVLSAADKAGSGIMASDDMSSSIRVVVPFARG